MLEKEVSQLDQDFITMWSYYILYMESGIDGLTNKALIELAEQGQINALQTYYLFYKPGDNGVIDTHIAVLENTSGLNFNEKFAISNYYESEEKIKTNKQLLYDEIESRMKANDCFDESFDELLEEIKKYKSYRYYHAACDDAIYECNKTKNPLVGQRALEMSLCSMFAIARVSKSEAVNGSLYKEVKKEIKEVYKSLMKEYKKDPSNELIKYALGKNIVLLQSAYCDVNEKVMEFGKGLLRELANRPMIVTFNQTSITPRVKR